MAGIDLIYTVVVMDHEWSNSVVDIGNLLFGNPECGTGVRKGVPVLVFRNGGFINKTVFPAGMAFAAGIADIGRF